MSPSSFWRGPSAQVTGRRPSTFGSTTTSGVKRSGLSVTRHDGIVALETLSAELDEVNAASVRPSPFATAAFALAYASNSERDPLGMDVRLFVVHGRGEDEKLGLVGFDPGPHLLGWAVFAFRVDEVIGSQHLDWIDHKSPALGGIVRQAARAGGAPRLELMATSDVDRPGIVARKGFEDVVAQSLLNHLVANERDWTLLEWRAQEQDSPLWRAAHNMATPFLRVRDVEIDPYSEVQLIWPDGGEYFRALSKRMRSNVSRQVRKLYASGEVEVFLANGPEVTSSLFGAYAELETRSWKHKSAAAMSRHPLRMKLYSRILSGRAGLEPSMIGVTLDGVLIAALINGRFGDRMWSMEMAFDESLNELGPGQLLLLLAGMDAIAKGCVSLNFFQLHGYFKKRWLADELPVVNLQLIRRPSLHDVRGLAGDSMRFVRAEAKRRAHSRNADQLPAGGEVGEAGASAGSTGGFNAVKRTANDDKAGLPSLRAPESACLVGAAGEALAIQEGKICQHRAAQALTAQQRALVAVAFEEARARLEHGSEENESLQVFNSVDALTLFPFPIR